MIWDGLRIFSMTQIARNAVRIDVQIPVFFYVFTWAFSVRTLIQKGSILTCGVRVMCALPLVCTELDIY